MILITMAETMIPNKDGLTHKLSMISHIWQSFSIFKKCSGQGSLSYGVVKGDLSANDFGNVCHHLQSSLEIKFKMAHPSWIGKTGTKFFRSFLFVCPSCHLKESYLFHFSQQ